MREPRGEPERFEDAQRLAEAVIAKVGKTIVMALPLGLGKANHIANAIYARAVADPSISLTIFTGLTLEPPIAKSDLERRFLGPIAQRVFAGYPPLDYATAIHAGTVPPNVRVDEFFFEAGQWLGSPYAQQNYISANYTHALRYVLDRGVNVVAQLVSRSDDGTGTFSLSCNPDLTVDLLELRRKGRADFLFLGQVNSELPFMAGDAAVAPHEFDALLDSPATDFPLFAPPREPIAAADYAAGLHAASLVVDGGTLQIGIGSLGDAVAKSLILRHSQNDQFCKLLARLGTTNGQDQSQLAPFDRGLYACTEMFVEGLLDLYRAGVVKREVEGAVLQAGFFLGSRAFYRALREMPPDERSKFHMTSISNVNQLYGNEEAKRHARVRGRFINDAMMVTLLGDVVSDALDDGRVVSGVGGQYNFVAQAFALDGARSVMMLRATRTSNGRTQSNIRWNYGHTTIPRHLRDIVVTEYGVADIRGKSDRDVIAALLAITDARFQDGLLRQAKRAGKIETTFQIPDGARSNTRDAIELALRPVMESGLLPVFPFGSDLTHIEQSLIPALQHLKSASGRERARLLISGLMSGSHHQDALARLGLASPRNLREWLVALVIRGAISDIGLHLES